MDCQKRIQYIREPRCRKCGKQLREDAEIFCLDCINKKHIVECGYALYDYQSIRKSIYRFKYSGRCEYAEFYAEDIFRHLGEEIKHMQAQAIVPIPLHSAKKRARGYNQAELIAKELSRLTRIPMAADLVLRVRNTLPQKELTPQLRQNNLKRAFNINADVVKLNKIILIDDIFTTGSTLDAVAVELQRHGVKTVYAITLCIGEGM